MNYYHAPDGSVHGIENLSPRQPPDGSVPITEERAREICGTAARKLTPEAARFERDARLAGSDWTDTLSAKLRLGGAAYTDWQNYRQALRDVPDQSGFPDAIEWPEIPALVWP